MQKLVYVAALTYKRPKMLRQLLENWRTLLIPDDLKVRFIVIDNDSAGSAEDVVRSFAEDFTCPLDYVIETQPGIPAARNRALNAAHLSGADLLCFNDDDGFPASDWLAKLTRCQSQTKANLVFGPQRPICNEKNLSRWKKLIAGGLIARASFVERYAIREWEKGRIATSGTYNWLCDIHWIYRRRFRFDETRAISGGSDTFFREAVNRAGGKLAWCSDAIVYEQLQAERLSLRYQLKRARAQGINSHRSGRQVFPRILRNPFGRMAVGLGLIIVPVLGKASYMLGLHMVGMAIGILQARRGSESELYTRQD